MIDEVLESWCAANTSNAALHILDEADVPAGPVNSIADIANDEQFKARGVFETVEVSGEVRTVPAMHPRLSEAPARSQWAGPELGEHTAEVLADWLDADNAQIAHWRSAQII